MYTSVLMNTAEIFVILLQDSHRAKSQGRQSGPGYLLPSSCKDGKGGVDLVSRMDQEKSLKSSDEVITNTAHSLHLSHLLA